MRLLLLALALTAGNAYAQVDPKVAEQCKDARDFLGCVKAFTAPAKSADELTPLRYSMKQVAARLSSGTSLRDATATFQPVVDAHALVPLNKQKEKAYTDATLAIQLFDITKGTWSARIELTRYYDGTPYMPGKACELFAQQINRFNTIADASLSFSYKKRGLLGSVICQLTKRKHLCIGMSLSCSKREPLTPRLLQQERLKRRNDNSFVLLAPGIDIWKKTLESKSGPKQTLALLKPKRRNF